MEIHVALCAAVPNAAWVEFIPQLDVITQSRIETCQAPSNEKPSCGAGAKFTFQSQGCTGRSPSRALFSRMSA
jgi:hypothetical protein